jgi:nucleoside-diphosphate-sugar epimerase
MKLPSIIITGASGFIGHYLIDDLKDEFNIYAIARRSRIDARVPYHQNVKWIQCDISKKETVQKTADYISENEGAEYIFHLAAFYDFSYKDNSEYHQTNVIGTENILNLGKQLKIKRFIFASSLAACEFPKNGEFITEETPAIADYPYARSKRIGEELIKNYSNYFPCTVVRFAAVYSDWCEYAPLYKFLNTWLSKIIGSKILAGRGESAIPYIHINDIIAIYRKILQKHKKLPEFSILNASPSGSTSHLELFRIATNYYYGEVIRSLFLPKFLAYPGLLAKNLLKYTHIISEEPFEKFWMIKYIDQKLDVDSAYTQKVLDWEPTPRYHIKRRLLFLLEKFNNHNTEWKLKNEAVFNRVSRRINISIYETLSKHKEIILAEIINIIENSNKTYFFKRYKQLNPKDFHDYLHALYHLIMATVRSNDRNLMLQYIDDIAIRRFSDGFLPQELCATLQVYKDIIMKSLLSMDEYKDLKIEVYDNIGLNLQLAQDEVEDLYENLIKIISIDKLSESALMPDCTEIQKMIHQLSAFYQISPESAFTRIDREMLK